MDWVCSLAAGAHCNGGFSPPGLSTNVDTGSSVFCLPALGSEVRIVFSQISTASIQTLLLHRDSQQAHTDTHTHGSEDSLLTFERLQLNDVEPERGSFFCFFFPPTCGIIFFSSSCQKSVLQIKSNLRVGTFRFRGTVSKM